MHFFDNYTQIKSVLAFKRPSIQQINFLETFSLTKVKSLLLWNLFVIPT
ncbi:MAG: hypothetical protein HeimC3_32230 [Candidatus Heimdallarchaeota archaeon LC_3]|nr:MAG: hypothetical protein HeimC3_32230 [Candidatus Heimdallarchaeota archaeon LC_3]